MHCLKIKRMVLRHLKKFIDGYKTSSNFLITNSITETNAWTETEIKNRTDELFKDISAIWPLD